MKKTALMLLSLLSLSCTSLVFANHEHYALHFTSGDTYDVTIDGSHVSWKGIAGIDKDEQRENEAKHVSLANNVTVYQWNEKKTGSFVVLVLDRKNRHVACTGKRTDNTTWFWQGSMKKIS